MKKINQLKLFGVGAVLLSASISMAGVGSHGGNVVDCTGKPAVVLDYYDATLPTLAGPVSTIDISGLSRDQVVQTLLGRIWDYAFFIDQIKVAMTKIGPMNDWKAADLKQIDDSAEPYNLPPSCMRRTAADREEDPLIMYADPVVVSLLSPAQQGILYFHEALYLIASEHGQLNSKNVRLLMGQLLATSPSQDKLKDAIDRMGGNSTFFKGFNHVKIGRYSNDPYFRDLNQGYDIVAVDLNKKQLHLQYWADPQKGFSLDHAGLSSMADLTFQCDSSASCTLITPNTSCSAKLNLDDRNSGSLVQLLAPCLDGKWGNSSVYSYLQPTN